MTDELCQTCFKLLTPEQVLGCSRKGCSHWVDQNKQIQTVDRKALSEENIEELVNKANDLVRTVSDGSTASYYELPSEARELQDLISYKNMNAQIGEIFRAAYRYGQSSHSDQLRDAKKIKFYADAEIERLENYGP